jgi:plastocyanin
LLDNPTPGRIRWRSGVLLSGLLLAGAACDQVSPGATIDLDTAQVQLERGSRLHEVRVGGVAALDSITPTEVRARPGDAVRFTVDDHRTHALAFDAERLAPDARAFLEGTHQLRGPPLVNRGAAWIVVLEEAPPGRYPYLCRSHGTRGMLLVGLEY